MAGVSRGMKKKACGGGSLRKVCVLVPCALRYVLAEASYRGNMIERLIGLVDELQGHRPRSPWNDREHPAPQQEGACGILFRFIGRRCEFGRDCAYPGLGWRCGHQCH